MYYSPPKGYYLYLFRRIRFARFNRGRKIIQHKYKTLLSQRQFFIYTISLWNNLANYIQNIVTLV